MEAVANTAARPGLDPTSRHATRAASNKPGVAFWEDVVLFETFDRGDLSLVLLRKEATLLMGMVLPQPSQGSDSEAINVWVTPDLYWKVCQSAPLQEEEMIRRNTSMHKEK